MEAAGTREREARNRKVQEARKSVEAVAIAVILTQPLPAPRPRSAMAGHGPMMISG